MDIDKLKSEIRNCTICEPMLGHEARPVFKFSTNSKLLIIGQAPGIRVHKTGIPWNDASGNRLRSWLNLSKEEFYDEEKIAITPMGFCFPGYDNKGNDKPPRKECAPTWHAKTKLFMPQIKLTLLIGTYAHKYYLKKNIKENMSKTVYAYKDYLPEFLPLPHPSWRNTGWINNNIWFTNELIPDLQKIIKEIL